MLMDDEKLERIVDDLYILFPLFRKKLFKHGNIERLIAYFKKIVSIVINDTNLEISQIEIISEAEKKQILFDFNDTASAYPFDKTIDELFREQAGDLMPVLFQNLADRQERLHVATGSYGYQ